MPPPCKRAARVEASSPSAIPGRCLVSAAGEHGAAGERRRFDKGHHGAQRDTAAGTKMRKTLVKVIKPPPEDLLKDLTC